MADVKPKAKPFKGAIVGAPVSREVADWLRNLKAPGAREPYHVTLLFMAPDNGTIDDHKRNEIHRAVRAVCMQHDELQFSVSGFGHFVQNGQTCWYASIDAPGLNELRTDIKRAVQQVIDLPEDDEDAVERHGFDPHMTIGYVPTGKKWSPPELAAAMLPKWSVRTIYLAYGDERQPVLLTGPQQQLRRLVDITKSERSDFRGAPLYIDVVKARQRGSQAAHHRYLVRFVLPPAPDGTPRYLYVYPDEEDVEAFDPKRGYTLKRPLAQIINDKLFGKEDKHGNKTEGLLYSYQKETQAPYLKEAPGTPVRGRTIMRKYQKVPGYVDAEFGPGVKASGYKLPKMVTELQFETPEQVEEARQTAPGYGIAPGKKPMTVEQFAEVKPVPTSSDAPAGTVSIFPMREKFTTLATPQTEQTVEALNEPLEVTVDPLAPAKDLADAARAKVAPFPEWMVEKYESDEAKLYDELEQRPATTMMTLGRFNSRNKLMSSRLLKEWAGIIHNIAFKTFDAYKLSGRYAQFKDQDEEAGRSGNHPESKVRKYRSALLQDLTQQANQELLETAYAYKADKSIPNRFDKVAYARITGALNNYARKQLKHEVGDAPQYQPEGGTYEPIVHEEDVEEAAHRQGRQIELAPDEAVELARYTAPAKATLLRVLNGKKFPETYQRIFLARLWLDEGGEQREAGEMDARKLERDQTGGGPPAGFSTRWYRTWTGPGSIAEQHQKWTDPSTGKTYDFTKVKPQMQRYLLNKWFDEALVRVKQQLSHSVTRGHGENARTVRALTPEGKMVKRWLELEAKLAGQNRRTFTDRERHAVKLETLPAAGTPAPGRLEELPASGRFFSHNQDLARRLGINPTAFAHHQRRAPNVSMGTHAEHQLAAAERFHNTLLELHGLDRNQLHARVKDAEERAGNLRTLGHVKDGQWHEEGGKGVQALHEAVESFQAARGAGDKDKIETAKRRVVEVAEHVGKLHPRILEEYQQSIRNNTPVTTDRLDEHKKELHTALHSIDSELAMLRFETNRRNTTEEVAKAFSADVPADHLYEVMYDLDFELGQLYATGAANA